MALVERGGRVRAAVMPRVYAEDLRAHIVKHVDQDVRLMTDESPLYVGPGKLGSHETVKHSIKEYVRGDVHTNTVEGFFSLLKRGITGVSTTTLALGMCLATSTNSRSATTRAR